jgi:hypothetical protein
MVEVDVELGNVLVTHTSLVSLSIEVRFARTIDSMNQHTTACMKCALRMEQGLFGESNFIFNQQPNAESILRQSVAVINQQLHNVQTRNWLCVSLPIREISPNFRQANQSGQIPSNASRIEQPDKISTESSNRRW